MKTLFYSNDINEIKLELYNNIQNQVPEIKIETVDSIQRLSRKLCQPLNQVAVIITWIHIKNELDSLTTLIPLFENIRVILILPDREQQTISSGIKLKPCFISYADNNPKEIIAVLKKIQLATRENQ